MKTTNSHKPINQIFIWIFFIAFCFIIQESKAQNCFIQLDDGSGLELSEDIGELNTASCGLLSSFPAIFQDSFAVFDFGFYTYQSLYEEGLEEFKSKMIEEQVTKKYYLIFGREIDYETKKINLWFEMNLPDYDIFECLNSIKVELLKTRIQKIFENSNYNQIANAIRLVNEKIVDLADCCNQEFRTGCPVCMTSDEIKLIFESRGSIVAPTSVSQDPESFQSGSSRTGFLIGEGFWIIDYDDDDKLISETVSELHSLMDGINLTFQAFITSNSTTCNLVNFQEIEDAYNASEADVRLRLHVDEDAGLIYDITDLEKIIEYYGNEVLGEYSDLINQGSNRSGLRQANCAETNRALFSEFALFESDPELYTSGSEGIMAHNIIQAYYRVLHPCDNIQIEYKIPESSKGTNPLASGYADIVNLSISSREIFEIKTVASWRKGVDEVIRYVSKANDFCKGQILKSFTRGTSYPQKMELSWCTPNKKLITHRHLDAAPEYGVISYELKTVNKEWKPSLEPVIIPETEWDRILDLLRLMVTSSVPKDLAIDYILQNPEIRPYLIVAGVGIIVGVAIAAAKTLGISLIATGKLAIAAGVLVGVCLTVDTEPVGP